jgi:chaperonin GroES
MAVRARPLHDRIIVRTDEPEKVTKGGIHLVTSGKEAQRRGEVLAVGPGIYSQAGTFIETTLKPGDRVIFGSYAGTEIKIEGETYRVMREGDVAAVIEEGELKDVETGTLEKRREGSAVQYQ